MNTYYQCLIRNEGRYKLVWLPELYCVENQKVNILFKDWEKWTVREVYSSPNDDVYDGKKLIWVGKTHSLTGEKLQERLKLDRGMISPKRIKWSK